MSLLPAVISEEAQKLAMDAVVRLYELDATSLGGEVLRFCSSVDASLSIDELTSSGLLATCTTLTPHAMVSGDSVSISDAAQNEYNGDFFVTVIDPLTFTYPILSATVSPATTETSIKGYRLNNTLVFDEQNYYPIPMEIEGFEWNGQGTLPNPKWRVSNVKKTLLASVRNLRDLVGCKFTRIRTFRKHLDDGTDPDTDALFPKDILRINQKTAQNSAFIEFSLAAAIDQEGAKIPGRMALKSTCTHRYRIWDAESESFDYTKATCPYVGSTLFTNKDLVTSDPSLDRCGKHLSSCKLRFGNAPLPTRAFPGIGGR